MDLLDSSATTRMETYLWIQSLEEQSIAMLQLEMWAISCCTNSTMFFPTYTAVLEHSAVPHVAGTMREGLRAEGSHAQGHLKVSEMTKISKRPISKLIRSSHLVYKPNIDPL